MARSIINIIGQRFGHLTALHPERVDGTIKWLCQCDCGKQIYEITGNLKAGRKTSCGCMNWAKQRNDSEMKMKLRQNIQKAGLVKRFAGMTVNSMKRGNPSMGISGIRGVSWVSTVQKWEVRLQVNGEKINCGRFDTLDEAAKAREEAEKQYLLPLYKDYLRKKKKLEAIADSEWDAEKEERKAELEKEVKAYEKRSNLIGTLIHANTERRKKKEDAEREARRKSFHPEL